METAQTGTRESSIGDDHTSKIVPFLEMPGLPDGYKINEYGQKKSLEMDMDEENANNGQLTINGISDIPLKIQIESKKSSPRVLEVIEENDNVRGVYQEPEALVGIRQTEAFLDASPTADDELGATYKGTTCMNDILHQDATITVSSEHATYMSPSISHIGIDTNMVSNSESADEKDLMLVDNSPTAEPETQEIVPVVSPDSRLDEQVPRTDIGSEYSQLRAIISSIEGGQDTQAPLNEGGDDRNTVNTPTSPQTTEPLYTVAQPPVGVSTIIDAPVSSLWVPELDATGPGRQGGNINIEMEQPAAPIPPAEFHDAPSNGFSHDVSMLDSSDTIKNIEVERCLGRSDLPSDVQQYISMTEVRRTAKDVNMKDNSRDIHPDGPSLRQVYSLPRNGAETDAAFRETKPIMGNSLNGLEVDGDETGNNLAAKKKEEHEMDLDHVPSVIPELHLQEAPITPHALQNPGSSPGTPRHDLKQLRSHGFQDQATNTDGKAPKSSSDPELEPIKKKQKTTKETKSNARAMAAGAKNGAAKSAPKPAPTASKKMMKGKKRNEPDDEYADSTSEDDLASPIHQRMKPTTPSRSEYETTYGRRATRSESNKQTERPNYVDSYEDSMEHGEDEVKAEDTGTKANGKSKTMASTRATSPETTPAKFAKPAMPATPAIKFKARGAPKSASTLGVLPNKYGFSNLGRRARSNVGTGAGADAGADGGEAEPAKSSPVSKRTRMATNEQDKANNIGRRTRSAGRGGKGRRSA